MSNEKPTLLTEAYDDYKPDVLDEGENGPLVLRGIVGLTEVANRNNRVYSESIFRNILADGSNFTRQLKENRVLGELSHPKDAPSLERVSHVVQKLFLENKSDKNCRVCESGGPRHSHLIGEQRVLDTPCGKILRALVAGGINPPVSTRGMGSCTNRGGSLYVNPDYQLITYDHVINPSVETAHVRPVNGLNESFIHVVENLITDHTSPAELAGYKNILSRFYENVPIDYKDSVSGLIETIDNRLVYHNDTKTSFQVPESYSTNKVEPEMTETRRANVEVSMSMDNTEQKINEKAREIAASEVQRVREEYEGHLAEAVSTINALQDSLGDAEVRYEKAESVGKELLSRVKELQIKCEAYKNHIEENSQTQSEDGDNELSVKFDISKQIIEELVSRVQRLMACEQRAVAAEALLGEAVSRIRRDRLVDHVDRLISAAGISEGVAKKIKPMLLEAETPQEANAKFSSIYGLLSEGTGTKPAPVTKKEKVRSEGALPSNNQVVEQTLTGDPNESQRIDEAGSAARTLARQVLKRSLSAKIEPNLA